MKDKNFIINAFIKGFSLERIWCDDHIFVHTLFSTLYLWDDAVSYTLQKIMTLLEVSFLKTPRSAD